jgi:hypothetical protein
LHAWFVREAFIFYATGGSLKNKLAEQQTKMQLERIAGQGAFIKINLG